MEAKNQRLQSELSHERQAAATATDWWLGTLRLRFPNLIVHFPLLTWKLNRAPCDRAVLFVWGQFGFPRECCAGDSGLGRFDEQFLCICSVMYGVLQTLNPKLNPRPETQTPAQTDTSIPNLNPAACVLIHKPQTL